jgi:hypothetical protein
MEQHATKTESAETAKLRLTISSLEHRLRVTEGQHAEDMHELQAQLEVVEQQLLIEVCPLSAISFW